jgi:hypothetical protein
LRWKNRIGEGNEYPDGGEADRGAARKILQHHRSAKIAEPWQSWVGRLLDAYLEIQDDRIVSGDNWPLRHLTRKLTALVCQVGDRGLVAKEKPADA